ncbi:MAG: hypothetical protein J6J83_08115 [Oscillospiraceae bacterium]|nr:hypothetical protein [Oscillospiraceae bacterium]
MQRGCFEAAPRLAGANSARETAGATVGPSPQQRWIVYPADAHALPAVPMACPAAGG